MPDQQTVARGRMKHVAHTGLVLLSCLIFLCAATASWLKVAGDSAQWQAAGAAEVTIRRVPGDGSRPPFIVEPTTALALLQRLAVKNPVSAEGYRREQFGQPWYDLDHNGCDTRNDVLRRDLQQQELAKGSPCRISSGVLADPYTGKTIDFKRGAETSSQVQIDHLVSLSDAWRKGAQQLSAAQRLALANDPLNLLAVDGPQNVKKSASDAAQWLPPQEGFRCDYVARQISVKASYGLWVSEPEKAAMLRIIGRCPQQRTWKSAVPADP